MNERSPENVASSVARAGINDYCEQAAVAPHQMDAAWAGGWRHFGPVFFRYSETVYQERVVDVVPLRIDLQRFTLSKSQRRVWRRNQDLECRVRPTVIDAARRTLFAVHCRRFTENRPTSLEDFLGSNPAEVPCRNLEFGLYRGDRLFAASFLDLGLRSVSSVYGIFDPEESKRSLGVCTMLHEIFWSQAKGYRYYYPGYAFEQSSHYDYKKAFAGLEGFRWGQGWIPRTWS